jgi:hypothetical protein
MNKNKTSPAEVLALFWTAPNNALFNQNDAAIVLSRSTAFLERHRWSGGGPEFKKFGTSVRYEKQAIIDYLNLFQNVKTTTA